LLEFEITNSVSLFAVFQNTDALSGNVYQIKHVAFFDLFLEHRHELTNLRLDSRQITTGRRFKAIHARRTHPLPGNHARGNVQGNGLMLISIDHSRSEE